MKEFDYKKTLDKVTLSEEKKKDIANNIICNNSETKKNKKYRSRGKQAAILITAMLFVYAAAFSIFSFCFNQDNNLKQTSIDNNSKNASNNAAQETQNGDIYFEKTINGTKDGVDELYYLLDYKTKDEFSSLNYQNITPANLNENTEFSIFINKNYEAVLIYENKPYNLSVDGGYGINDIEVADLNKDGIEELYYTYNFGFGLIRTKINYFNFANKKLNKLNYEYLITESTNNCYEMMIYKDKNNNLSLFSASYHQLSEENQFGHKLKSGEKLADIVYQDNTILVEEY